MHGESCHTIRDSGRKYDGMDTGGNRGEGNCRTMVGDTGKYNAISVPIMPTPRGYGLYDNGNAAKLIWRFQRYRVGGGDLEVVHCHHEQTPLLRHHNK